MEHTCAKTLTGNASMARLEVRRQIFRTRVRLAQSFVGDEEAAAVSTGAERVEVTKDVDGTADVAVILRDAAADPDAPVASRLHQDDLVDGAGDVQHLPLAVVLEGRFDGGIGSFRGCV